MAENRAKEFTFLKNPFLWKHTVTILNYLQTLSLENILVEHFTWSNSIILVEDLINCKRGFEIIFYDYYAVDIGNKNIAVT